jgi:hypothetical protein
LKKDLPPPKEDASATASANEKANLGPKPAGPTPSGVEEKPRPARPEVMSRTGGVYIPPFKLAQLQQEIMQSSERNSIEHQKLMWELLRKSINGIINKVRS